MQDYRCKLCKKLLFKRVDYFNQPSIESVKDVDTNELLKALYKRIAIEIKCPKCKKVNLVDFRN